MRLLRIAFLAGLVAFAGCYHAVGRAGQQAGAEETRTGWNLFWGIFDANFDITNCPNGIAYVEVWHPWWGFVPEILTAGIVSPQRMTYVCSAQAGMIQPGYAPQPPPMPQYQPQPPYPPPPPQAPQAVAPPPPPPPPAAAPYQPPAAEEAAAEEPAPAKPAKKAKKPAKKAKKPAPPPSE